MSSCYELIMCQIMSSALLRVSNAELKDSKAGSYLTLRPLPGLPCHSGKPATRGEAPAAGARRDQSPGYGLRLQRVCLDLRLQRP